MSYKKIIHESNGYFGPYGGKYIIESLRSNIEEVEQIFNLCKNDSGFQYELREAFLEISGRPTAFTPLRNLTHYLGGAQIVLKNEGLNHTGAHKITHCIGQILLAKRLNKCRIIAETGAGQHGLATATVCAKYGLKCTIYMGRVDYERQRPNVFYMEFLGAEVIPVDEGERTLNDAVMAAFKDLMKNPDSFYLLGSAVGPHPYPAMNTYFQKIIGEEIKQQSVNAFGQNPDYIIACVGGGSNAMGAFFDFLDDEDVKLVGVEAGGQSTKNGNHASKVSFGKVGIFEGYKSYFLQDNDANILPTHSISAGLDYCGVSPILAYLHDAGRVDFTYATNEETLAALQLCAQKEGFILALESSHAMAHAIKLAPTLSNDEIIVVAASGRGDKDLFITMKHFQNEQMVAFMEKMINENKKA